MAYTPVSPTTNPANSQGNPLSSRFSPNSGTNDIIAQLIAEMSPKKKTLGQRFVGPNPVENMPFMPPTGHFWGSKAQHSRDQNRGGIDPRSQFHAGRQARSARHDRRMAEAADRNAKRREQAEAEKKQRAAGAAQQREERIKRYQERMSKKEAGGAEQVTAPTSLVQPSRTFNPEPEPISQRMFERNRRDFDAIRTDASGSQARAREAARQRANQMQQLGSAGPMGVFTGINSFSPRMPWTPQTISAAMNSIPNVNDAANFAQGVQANASDMRVEAGRQYHRNLQGITDRFNQDMAGYRQIDRDRAFERDRMNFDDRMARMNVANADENLRAATDYANAEIGQMTGQFPDLFRELGVPFDNRYLDFLYRLGRDIVPDSFKHSY